MMRDDGEKDRSFVTALARGLEVLRTFRRGETYLSNQEIARRSGLPKPTISRLTHTLRSLGYLALNEATGAYRLDSGVLALGFGALGGIDIAERARVEMERLRGEISPYMTCGLAERHGLEAIYLLVNQSTQGVAMLAHPGARLPLFLSSAGLAILTRLPEAETDAALAALKASYPHKYADGRAALTRAREDMARLGFTRAYELWRSDVNGIATPLRSLCGTRIFGLNAGGPAFMASPALLERDVAPRLLDAARRLDPGR